MVINKSAGKGCAQSILSKVIAKKLIADGIADKPIDKTTYRSIDSVLRVSNRRDLYVTLRKAGRPAEGPLWIPSFIDAEIWRQAVRQFKPSETLDRNVEKFLLPKMDEYIEKISDEELASITRDYLLERGVLNTPIAQRKGNTYYFDKNEVYSLDKKSQLFPYEKGVKDNLYGARCWGIINMNVWHKAVSSFKVGETLKECVEVFLKTERVIHAPQELSPVDRLIQHISPAVYERVPENEDKSTFDRIRVTVGLPRSHFGSWEALENEVQKYQHEIYQRVIQKVEKDRRFRKYGVSINLLKLSNAVLPHDFSMEFIFELTWNGQSERLSP